MQPRLFTVEEVNRIIPVLSQRFERIWNIGEQIRNIDTDLRAVVGIWGDDVYRKPNPDHVHFHELLKRRCDMTKELADLLDIIGSVGCVVRDIDSGVADFYHKRGNQLVCLCWRYGEKRVKWWHPAEVGSKNRRPVEEIAAEGIIEEQTPRLAGLWKE